MAFYRTKRVELAEFDPKWSESFVLVKTTGLQDIFNKKKEIGHKNQEVQKLQKLSEKPGVTAEELEEYDTKATKLAGEIVALTYKMVSDVFVSGMIYDNDEDKTRPLLAEELKEFDSEVLKKVIEELTGNVPKA
jgi:hypothetical protein